MNFAIVYVSDYVITNQTGGVYYFVGQAGGMYEKQVDIGNGPDISEL